MQERGAATSLAVVLPRQGPPRRPRLFEEGPEPSGPVPRLVGRPVPLAQPPRERGQAIFQGIGDMVGPRENPPGVVAHHRSLTQNSDDAKRKTSQTGKPHASPLLLRLPSAGRHRRPRRLRVRRGGPPYALHPPQARPLRRSVGDPGRLPGHRRADREAARRELREETGLDFLGPVSPIGVFGEPGRDPRGRTISMAHAAAIPGPIPEVSGGDDAADAAWLDPNGPLELAFDHALILAAALDWLRQAIERGPIGLAMLPDEFGDAEIKALHRAVGNPARTATAWRSRMKRAGRIIPVGGCRRPLSPRRTVSRSSPSRLLRRSSDRLRTGFRSPSSAR